MNGALTMFLIVMSIVQVRTMMDLIMKHDDMDVEIVCSIGSAHSQRSS